MKTLSSHDRRTVSERHRGAKDVRPGASGSRAAERKAHWRYWLLGSWLVVVFLLGGSSRADVTGLLVLRPLSVLVLAVALGGLSGPAIMENRFMLGMAAAWLVLPLLQLVPLPPALWHALPGREVIRELDRQADLGEPWRPLSMVPAGTRNAIWALAAPLATLVLGIQLDERERHRLLAWVVAIAIFSALLGMLQMTGDPEGRLYYYAHTHKGLPIGLLANRNHQALLLASLMPMLAVLGAPKHLSARPGFAWLSWMLPFGGALLLVPLILLTGSRSGTVLGAIALAGAMFLVSRALRTRTGPGDSRSRTRGRRAILIVCVGVAAAVALTIALGRTLSLDRFVGLGPDYDPRVRVLPVVLSMVRTYGFWGTGFGTFDEVFRLHEPDALLSPVYMNHAHDDWLELVLTGGLPAVLLLLIGFCAIVRRLRRIGWARTAGAPTQIQALGLLIMLLVGLASITDYPLRVPSLACLGTVALLWWQSRVATSIEAQATAPDDRA